MRYELRPYQEAAVKQLWREFSQGATSVLEVAPTGAGKTVIACKLIEDALSGGERVAFLAHRDELISQCADKLQDNTIRHGVIKAGQDPRDLSARVHVCGVQTFRARQRFMRSDYRLIIIDEAHHAPAGTYQEIIKHCAQGGDQPRVIGLTATPYRTDGKGLGEMFQRMIQVATTEQLVNWGFLVPPRVFRAQRLDLSGVHVKGKDYDEAELERAVNRPLLIGHAVNEYLRLARGMRAAAFCVNRAHSRAVAEAFRLSGIPAEHLDGETPTGERQGILERLHLGRTLVVCNVGVLTEGWDEPWCEAVLALRPTKSRCLWRQIVGRGARLCCGKEPCRCGLRKKYFLLLDHANWTGEHGYFTDPDNVTLHKGLANERPEATVTCRACGVKLASRPRICPACGEPMISGEQEDTIGLGDASVSLEEDAPFFDHWREERPSAKPTAPAWTPGPPSMRRVARRSRGL